MAGIPSRAESPNAYDASSGAAPPAGKVSYFAPLSVLTSLFFMWGFLTSLNDIIIPHLKAIFELDYFRAMWVNTAFFMSYFVMSVPSGLLVRRFGYKNGIVIGLLGAALGCLFLYPAAGMRSYGLFLFALFVLGSGITLLQVAANPFVAVLGKPETASARLTLTQAFNSLATFLGPKFGKWAILSTAVLGSVELAKLTPTALEAYKLSEAQSVQMPYVGLAVTLVLLAVAMALFKLPKINDESPTVAAAAAGTDAYHKSAWSYRHLVLGAVGIFVYVGAEVSIGSVLVNYFSEPYMGGFSSRDGADLLSYYWLAAMFGRFAGSLVTLRFYRPGKVLAVHALVAAGLTLVTMGTIGFVGRWSVISIGFFNSIMFPTIFTLALDRLGKHTSQGSGILCMAIVGGALLPPVMGIAADKLGIHHCFFIATICYVYIAWYGLRGHATDAKPIAAVAG
jgi:FHS family L-fucose permease-like MFS transporter